jgi:hypothetical protein
MKSIFKNYLRKAAFIFIAFTFINATLYLKAEEYTVTVAGPGQLENAVSQMVGGSANYYLITSLTVIGNLNQSDITFLQDLGYMASQGGLGILEYLDISVTNLPNNTLPAFAFSYVDIDEIILPNSVQTYEWQCFFNSNVKYVTIGTATSILFEDPTPNYNSMDYTAFSNTLEMVAYEVAADNQHFASVDGVIYSKDMKNLVAYPSNKPDNAFVIPASVEKICFAAISNTCNLNSITIPNSLKVISDYGFTGGNGLSDIQWGTGLETIGYSAFMRAVNMGELALPEGLTKIVSSAFYSAGITKLTGPSTLTTLGYDCFRGDGFDGSPLETVDFSNCTNLLTLTGSTFYDCHYLKNVTLPEGLKVVGDASFQNCYSIEEITIPNSVQTIEVNAFWMFSELYVHKMEKVVLGSGLQQIQSNAFGECGNIVEIYSLNPVPPTLANDGFDTPLNNSATLYVPVGSLTAYQTANRWQDFNHIEESTVGIYDNSFAQSDCKIYNSMNRLVIENAKPGEIATIYSTTGALVKIVRISGNVEQVELPKGIFLVRVNNYTAKVVM